MNEAYTIVSFVIEMKRPGKRSKWFTVDSGADLFGAFEVYRSWDTSREKISGKYQLRLVRRTAMINDEIIEVS